MAPACALTAAHAPAGAALESADLFGFAHLRPFPFRLADHPRLSYHAGGLGAAVAPEIAAASGRPFLLVPRNLEVRMSVVVSTIFDLKTDREEEFIRRWRALALFFIQQPGFVRVHLNRSLERRGHFLLIAEWASQADYKEAMRQPQLGELARDFPAEYQIAVYETVVALARPG